MLDELFKSSLFFKDKVCYLKNSWCYLEKIGELVIFLKISIIKRYYLKITYINLKLFIFIKNYLY
jgi:hypothetical protein